MNVVLARYSVDEVDEEKATHSRSPFGHTVSPAEWLCHISSGRRPAAMIASDGVFSGGMGASGLLRNHGFAGGGPSFTCAVACFTHSWVKTGSGV